MFLKRYSENISKHTYPSAIDIRNFIEIAFRRGCSRINLLHIFRTPFSNKTSGGLFLTLALATSDRTFIVNLIKIADSLNDFNIKENFLGLMF